MIIHADGQPTRPRYSVGLAGSMLLHAAIVAILLTFVGTMGPARPGETGEGRGGRYPGPHSSALLGASQFGGDPSGIAGDNAALQEVQATPWPVAQAKRLRLKFAIGWAIDHLWQSTLFALVIGLLTLAFRRNRARVRYALWFGASLKFLVPFSLMMAIGSTIGSGVVAVLRILGVTAPLGVAGGGSLASSSESSRTFIDASLSFLQDVVRHPLISGIGQDLAAAGTVALWPSTFTITEVTAAWFSLALLGIWTWGFFAIVASRVRRSRQVWEIALTSRRVELLDVKVPKRLQVGLSEGLLEPGVIGWFNPVMLLPADIERHLTRPELEAIVAHELCHVRRFDNMTAAIHMLVEAIFWFHPLVWWLGVRLVDERERACDEHVLRSGGAPGTYAQGILNVCKRYVQAPLASVSGVGSANVRQRIDAILANRIGEATGPWKRVMLSGLVFCMLIVPLAAGALQPPPQAPRRTAPSQPVQQLRFATSVSVAADPAYMLVLAHANGQLGPELRPAGTVSPDAPAIDASLAYPTVRPREISSNAMTLPRLSALLSSVVGGNVEDRTGLNGHYRIRLAWTSHPSGPSLSTAVEQQLGLRLVPLQ